MADYGSGRYNDHHFHYGYFIYAAAVIAQLDEEYYNAHKSGLDSFVLDVCNYDQGEVLESGSPFSYAPYAPAPIGAPIQSHKPAVKQESMQGTEGQAYYPFARHKEFFDGHSW